MRIYRVEIIGICPILFNRFLPEAMEVLDDPSKRGKKKAKNAKMVEAQRKVYRMNDAEKGPIGIPACNLKKSLLQGCGMAGLKIGRKSAEPYMRATVFLGKPFIPIIGKKKPDGIHECTGRIPPRTGSRAIIRRPYLDAGWRCEFELHATDERIGQEMLFEALSEAGLIVGVCDYRPEFGRYDIKGFEELN